MKRLDEELPPIYAATYDHFGIILWGLERYKEVLNNELDWLEHHQEYRMGWDHEAFTYDYLAENAPEILLQMKDSLNRYAGRLGVGSSTYGQPLSMFITEESNIRQMTLAMETSEKLLNYPLSVYMMSEHPFHPQLPQMLVGCGFKGAILRTHFMMYGQNPAYNAPVGFWKGVDGSRIPALPTYPNQLVDPIIFHVIPGLTSTLDNRILTDAPSDYCPLDLDDFRRAFGDQIQPLIATRADDTRNRESLIKKHEDSPNHQWILIEDIFKLLPQPRTEFSPGANDFKVRMPWGYCGNWIWNRCREAEVRVQTAERLAAIYFAISQVESDSRLEPAWKNLLVAQHHDIQICGLEKDAQTFLDASLQTSNAVINDVMDAISLRIGHAGPRQVLFNPLPWERKEWIPSDQGGSVQTIAGLGFKALPIESIEKKVVEPTFQWTPTGQSDSLRFPANLEASVVTTIWKYESVGVLLTPHYEVCFSPTGGIRLLRDLVSGKPLMSPPKTSAKLVGVINGVEHESIGTISKVELNSDCALLIETGQIGGIPYRSEWTFYAHTRRIDWHGELIFNAEWIGRLKVPINSSESQLSVQGHDLSSQVVPAFNEHEYKLRLRFYPRLSAHMKGIRDLPAYIDETESPTVQGLYWTALADQQTGLALFNRGQMGSVHESDDAFSSILAFSLPYIWGTRILKGKYTYDLGILPFIGPWQQANLQRQALEYNFPLVQRKISDGSDSLGEAWSPYQETSKGDVILSALFVKNKKLFARYYECSGDAAEVVLEWMGKQMRFTSSDFRERVQGGLGRRLKLLPWQIQTVTFH